MPQTDREWQTRIGRRVKLRDLQILSTVVQGRMKSAAALAGIAYITRPASAAAAMNHSG
jgi:hypothetical protein